MNLNLINLLITVFLVGLIWVIQLVQYPSFAFTDPNEFSAFHQHHSASIGILVVPLMLAELTLGAYLALTSDLGWKMWLAFTLVIFIWLSTFLIQVPLHGKLAVGKDLEIIQQLVSTNWIRTVLWTMKGALLVWVFMDKAP